MKQLALVALVAFFATVTLAQDAPGMYVDQAGSLVEMKHVQFAGSGSKGVAKSVFVPGTSASVVWDYRGAQAPVRVSARPHFVYRMRPNQGISERDIVLVRMDQKTDHREIRIAKVRAFGNNQTGYDEKSLVALTVTRSGETLQISPATDLAPGEYFMTAGFSAIGFDFGVERGQ